MNRLDLYLLNFGFVNIDRTWCYNNLNSLFSRIYYITDGEAYVTHHKKTYRLRPDQMYLIPAFTACDYFCKGKMKLYYVHLLERYSGGMSLLEDFSFQFEYPGTSLDHQLFRRLQQLHQDKALVHTNPDKYSDYEKGISAITNIADKAVVETNGILQQLLSRFIVNEKPIDSERALHTERMRKVTKFVMEHLYEKVTVQKLADVACLHPEYFSKWFHKSTGLNPIEYINRKKIEESQRMLILSGETVDCISQKMGFYNHSHFIKTFKKYLKVTPAEYRSVHHRQQGGII